MSLSVGKTYSLKLKKAKGKIIWSSANKKIAKVSKKGKITAVSVGKTTIKAKNQKKIYKCRIKVISKKTNSQKKKKTTEQSTTTESPDDTKGMVIGNRNSKVYHSPKCDGLPYERNRIYFDSWEKAEGFRACGNCHGGKSDY